MSYKALESFALAKEDFERALGNPITDEQWSALADEIDGRVDNYLDELLGMLVIEVQEGEWG